MSDQRPDAILKAADEDERPNGAADAIGRGGRIDFTEADDDVEEADEESFPASDPPSYSPRTVEPPDQNPVSKS